MKGLLTLFLLAYCNHAFSQSDLSKLDKLSFVIGTLDDYGGHKQTLSSPKDSTYYQLVDYYTKKQEYIALLIDSLYKSDCNDFRMEDKGVIWAHSKLLSEKINDYYDYLPSGSFTRQHDTIFSGCIRKDKLSTNTEKISFLAGAFLRHGGKTDKNEYYISIANSTGKAKLCADILKELNCKDVKYIILQKHIPTGHWITFTPSGHVLDVLNKVESLSKNNSLSSSMLSFIMSTKNRITILE